MKDLSNFLSSAPVLATVWMVVTAGALIQPLIARFIVVSFLNIQ